MIKKIFILICLLISGAVYAQEPVYNQMRNNYQFRGVRVDSLLLIPKFNDTASASYLNGITGALIRVGTFVYLRDANAQKWLLINSSAVSVDTTSLSQRIDQRVKYTDTAAMLNPYLLESDTSSLSYRINLRVRYTDTSAMLQPYLYKSDSVRFVKYTDTAAFLSPYLKKQDTLSLSNRIDLKIDSLKKSNDSVYFEKNGVWIYSFKDSVNAGQNGRFGNDTASVVMAKVHNDAGNTLTNGEVVFLSSSGTNSDAPSVRRAINKSDSTSANTFGFVHGTIANNDTGWIVLSGKIEKLNTSAFANGDVIYLDSIAGKWTKSKPKAPYHMVYLGVVIKSNAGNGSIFVKCQNGYELDEIHDVQINNKVNNQILVYSDTQKVWKNRNVWAVVDTSTWSARIDERVKYSDTAAMLSNYMHYSDTVSLSNRINTKLTASDTSSLSSRINAKQSLLTGYDETNDRLGLHQATPTAALHINRNINSVTQNDTSGILLANSTAAISGTQSISPSIVWQGNGWKTDATAGSQDVRFRAYTLPVQGTANPTAQWLIESSINSGAYNQLFSLTSGSGASIGPINYSPGKINISSYNVKTAAPTENVMTLSSTETGAGAVYPTQLNFLQKGATVGWNIQSVNQGVGYTPIILNELGGNVLIGTPTNQGAKLNVNGTIRGSQFLLSALNTAPASATATGTTGEIRIVNGFIYVCVATNTWQRAALSTW